MTDSQTTVKSQSSIPPPKLGELPILVLGFLLLIIPVRVSKALRDFANKDYVEVRRPIGPLAGALGWTFDALSADFTSFDEVTQAFTDFDSLTLGDANV